MAKILILYHSRLGSVEQLTHLIARGVNAIDGMEAIIRTVPNISANTQSSEQVVPEAGAPYATLDDLKSCDGLILGSPTRFGHDVAIISSRHALSRPPI